MNWQGDICDHDSTLAQRIWRDCPYQRDAATASEYLQAAERGDLALAPADVPDIFSATDRLANAAMWLIAHMSYARRFDLTGAALEAKDFKQTPEGHMGGSLNMAVAFAGYLAANALSGHTRAWTLGQGHCVAAIEAINALTGDVSAR